MYILKSDAEMKSQVQNITQKIQEHIVPSQNSDLLLLDPIEWSGEMSAATTSTSVGVLDLAELNQFLKNKVIIRSFIVKVIFIPQTAQPLLSSVPNKGNSPESKSRQHSARSSISGRSSAKSVGKKEKVCHKQLPN